MIFIDTKAIHLDGLRRVVKAEAIDLLIPSTDAEVKTVSMVRKRIPCRVFLPRHSMIEQCQDKYRLARFLRLAGVPVPITCPMTTPARMKAIFPRLTASQPAARVVPGASRQWLRGRDPRAHARPGPVVGPVLERDAGHPCE